MNEGGWWVKAPNLDGVASLKGTFQPCAQGWICASQVKGGVGKHFKKRITKLLRHKRFPTKESWKTHVFLLPFHIYFLAIVLHRHSLDLFAVSELSIFIFKISKYIFCGLLQWLFELLKYYFISTITILCDFLFKETTFIIFFEIYLIFPQIWKKCDLKRYSYRIL